MASEPCAVIGAVGKGSCSTSEQSRKSAYPIVNLLTSAIAADSSAIAMGLNQSGSIYLSLMTGGSMGQVGTWVTVILFSEIKIGRAHV